MFTYNIKINTLADRTLISPFSITVSQGDKIALIGEEGNGKSVFLKALVDPGLLKALKIARSLSHNIIFGYLSQEISKMDQQETILDYCIQNDWNLYPKFMSEFNKILSNLEPERMIDTLSGGERMKVQIIRLLCLEPDCYVLDEPSNDIDFETLEFLESWMQSLDKPILFVSHDERLIQNVANKILHFEQTHRKTNSILTFYEGTYDAYRGQRINAITKHNTNVQNKINEKNKQLKRWDELYRKVSKDLKATKGNEPEKGRLLKKKMNQVKSMKKRFDKDTIDDKRDMEEAISLRFDKQDRQADSILFDYKVDELYIEDKYLGKSYQLSMRRKEKIACIGRNGIGKTVFLEELIKNLRIDFGVMYQDYSKNLDYDKTTIENLVMDGSNDELTQIMLRLGNLKFTESEMNAKVSMLSGGQKAKLSLLRLVFQNKSLILLDEPTRNLSPLSVSVIYEMLDAYEGAIYCITHDRNLIAAVFNYVLEFTEEGFKRIT